MDAKHTRQAPQQTKTETRRDDPLAPPAPPDPRDPFALIDHGEAALNDDQLQGITAGICLFRCRQQ